MARVDKRFSSEKFGSIESLRSTVLGQKSLGLLFQFVRPQ